MSRKYDVVVFGASGFTGRHVIKYLFRAQNEDGDLKWAVAGRSEGKLRKVLSDLTLAVDVLVCDVNDELSLRNMAEKTKLVLNCVGPYRFGGEKVVKACVGAATNYVDVSGETQFLETVQLLYDDEASKKGVYIVGACGFDSIPSDLGLATIHEVMGGPVNSVEMYLKIIIGEKAKGPMINFGTWQSAIHSIANSHELPALRKKLYPEKLPNRLPQCTRKSFLHNSEVLEEDKWCIPFLSSDRSVMTRSERSRYHNDKRRPAQVQAYLQFSSLLYAVLTCAVLMVLFVMTKFRLGRYLLETFPTLFSLGTVAKKGPSKDAMENCNFQMMLVGKGWPGEAESFDIQSPPNRQVTVTVKGNNIGYGATCECAVQAAVVLLKENNKIPVKGGVLTPGYAFANTTLVERLHQRGVTFNTDIKSI